MKITYLALIFDTADKDQEIWTAMLSEWPFDSFQEDGTTLTGYIHKEAYTSDLEEFIQFHEGRWYTSFQVTEMPDQNWNELWEKSFQPIPIDNVYYIRAEFHDPAPPGYRHEVLIAPRMAFGTGHHATTYMMLSAMSVLDFKSKQVFDFGCGTGLLSVVAAMEGAESVLGNDIQPEAIENSFEHARLNHVEARCVFIEGGIDKIKSNAFDILLANINSKIIIESFGSMLSLLAKDGIMLLSGIMKSEWPTVEKQLDLTSFDTPVVQYKDDWVQVTLRKMER